MVENRIRWSYKTVHFSLKKEGLLGSAFIDENEIEVSLNEFGKLGWELVSFMEVNDGLIAVFKQPFAQGLATLIPHEQVEEPQKAEEQREAKNSDAILGQTVVSMAGQKPGHEEPLEISPMADLSENPIPKKGDSGSPGVDVGSIRIL